MTRSSGHHWLARLLLLVSLSLLTAMSAHAAHFRGGAVSWQALALDGDGVKDDVVITVKTAWAINRAGTPSLQFTPSGPIPQLQSEDVVLVDGAYEFQTSVFEVKNLAVGTEYLVAFAGGNRISDLQNNANGSWNIQTLIQLANGNLAPNLEFPIIYQVPQKNRDESVLTS